MDSPIIYTVGHPTRSLDEPALEADLRPHTGVCDVAENFYTGVSRATASSAEITSWSRRTVSPA
jgi:hypothetical protein